LVAGSNGAVELLASLSQASETESVRLATTDALTVCLMSAENRDRLPEDAVRMLCTTLRDASLSAELHGATLDCVRLSCTKNELNRQKMVGEGLVPLVVPNLDTKRGTLVSRSCKLLRALVVDDDHRALMGKVQERAKLMVDADVIEALSQLLHDSCQTATADALAEMLGLLARLCIKDEYCKKFVDAGGLDTLLPIMQSQLNDKAVARASCQLIKALCGVDDIKDTVCSSPLMQLIIDLFQGAAVAAAVIEQACGVVAAIALRRPHNCARLAELNVGPMVVYAMRDSPAELGVQKQGCLALRNMVARYKDAKDPILNAGAEPIIRAAMVTHLSCIDHAKAALRDLGCHVELREEWKGGTGGIKQGGMSQGFEDQADELFSDLKESAAKEIGPKMQALNSK